jgi:hypothetical protein
MRIIVLKDNRKNISLKSVEKIRKFYLTLKPEKPIAESGGEIKNII